MTFPTLPPSTTLATVRSEPPPGPPFGLAGLTGLTGLEGPLLAALGLGLLLGAHRHVAPNCRPDQILVIAGRGRRRGDGQRIGYRVVHGGRALMVPWLEHRRWMDVRTRAVPIRVAKAYAQGGTPIDVEAIATVKISTDPACVGNAIERFLGHEPAAVQEVAARSLEGHLRVMVAGMTPEQVNQDRLRFADRVLEVTRPDMIKLGLQVDTFKIQRLSDTVDYLLQALRPEGRRHGLQPTQGEEHGGGGIERGQDTAPSSQAAARRSPRNWRVVVPETLVRVATRAGERAGVGQQGPVALQQHPILPQQPHQRRVALHQRQQLAIDRCAGGHPRQPQPLEHRGSPGAEARADGDRPGQAGRRHHGAHLLVGVGIHRGGGDRRRVDGRPPTYRWVQPDATDSTTPPPSRAPAKATLAGGHG